MRNKTTTRPAARIAPQIPNIDSKPATAATPPIAVAPMASPAWRELLAAPIASPLALKEARSATRAKLAVIAVLLVLVPLFLVTVIWLVTIYSTLGEGRAIRANMILEEWAEFALKDPEFIHSLSQHSFSLGSEGEELFKRRPIAADICGCAKIHERHFASPSMRVFQQNCRNFELYGR